MVIDSGKGSLTLIPWILSFFSITASTVLIWLSGAVTHAELLFLTSIAGFLVLTPVLEVVVGSRDVFSPYGFVSLLMFLGMYVAPLLHVALNRYPAHLSLPSDMPRALADVAVLYVAGAVLFTLVTYRPVRSTKVLRPAPAPAESDAALRASVRNLVIAGVGSLCVFLYTVILSGGPASWLERQLNYRTALNIPGWALALAEAFPSLFFFAYCINLRRSERSRTELVGAVLWGIVVLVLVTFATSGLRGSRANLIWPTLIGLIFVHFVLLRLRKRVLALIAGALAAFAAVYDVYKKRGVDDAVQALSGGLNGFEGDRFGLASVILGDFSRSGIQAVLLDVWHEGSQALSYGLTYIGDAVLFIPGLDDSLHIPSKTAVGSEWLYGEGAYAVGEVSSRIFGLQGEALLNFGVWGFVLVLLPFGLIVRRADARYRVTLRTPTVSEAVLASLVIPALGLAFVSDMDNVFRYATSNMILPLVAVWLAARRSNVPSDRSSVPR